MKKGLLIFIFTLLVIFIFRLSGYMLSNFIPSLDNYNQIDKAMAKDVCSDDPSEQLQDALEGNKLIVIKFYADWCGTCRAIAPSFNAVKKAYKSKVVFITVNVDENTELSNKFNIRLLPTIYAINPKTNDMTQIPVSVVADQARFKSNLDELINY